MIGQLLDLAEQMAGQENAPMLLLLLDETAHVGAADGIQGAVGLVQDQQTRVQNECCRDPQTLQHPSGEVGDPPLGHTGQPALIQRLEDTDVAGGA